MQPEIVASTPQITMRHLGRTKNGHPAALKRPRLIAIASGKGGVGKTWLSLTIAHALSGRRRRVLVVDADFGLANADIQLGHLPGVDLGAVLRQEIPLRDCIFPIEAGGFDLIAGQSGSGAFADTTPNAINLLLERLIDSAGEYDLILFDLGTGVERTMRHLSALADTVILVITEDPASLTDAYAVLKLLKHDRTAFGLPVDARIVVNQTNSETSAKRAHAALAKAARGFLRLDPPLLGTIERDQSVNEAIRGQKLLLAQFPQSAAADSVRAIARRLIAR
ncbi:AAA family ATPase [Acidiphilium sp. AL]|uniref:AAA family ATPase n=1 Tax=Acidiphilium iwatense TaxID=768198 RepID=A0ABS9DXL8_9PROT|nr:MULTISPECIES: AAA family ATPase [Acidiphilium]MCF3947494.1 AAA family ATPase [Acidiphilium iwatense]MCU4158547.1 AAA family ATPase [Acidiphilium sp. AL]